MRHSVVCLAALSLMLLPGVGVAETLFQLDTPEEGATVFGLVEVSGWILDDGGSCGPPPAWPTCDWTDALPSSVDLYVDGAYVASADLNQARYDVLQAYPWFAGTPFAAPGFSTSFDSSQLTNGPHELFVRVTLADNTIGEDYGQRTVIVDNTVNQAPFGELEFPGENQPMNGVFPISGWALDDGNVTAIEVVVDGYTVGHAVSGIHRPDIANRFPSHPGSEYAGFIRMLNTTELTNGVHTVAVRLFDDQGASRVIGRRFVQTLNTGYNLPPFGGIDWPIPNHIMFAKGCNDPANWSTPPFDDPEVVELVTGWAVDVDNSGDDGVTYVQLLLDGAVIADTYQGSEYWPWLRMDVNYYGIPRMDILRLFGDVDWAKDSGWAFRIDVSDLIIRHQVREGLHYLKVRAGDRSNNVADIATIPVIFDCDDDPDRPSWGDIYSPAPMEPVRGAFEVAGWAIDYDRIDYVEIWVDGEFIDYADEFGTPTPEVADQFPWLPTFLTGSAGFLYDLDTVSLGLTDGEHVLVVWTEDRWGGRTIIGERRFVIENPTFGAGATVGVLR